MNRIHRPSHLQRFVISGTTLAVVGLVLAAGWMRARETKSGPDEAESTPESCVSTMLKAAAAGDADRYMDCFAGNLRQQLEKRLARETRDRFAAELKTAEGELKNYVTSEWRFPADDEATFHLERIYSQFHERHTVRMRRLRTGWKIVELSPLDRFSPEIPYGTPVSSPPVEKDDTRRNNADPEFPMSAR